MLGFDLSLISRPVPDFATQCRAGWTRIDGLFSSHANYDLAGNTRIGNLLGLSALTLPTGVPSLWLDGDGQNPWVRRHSVADWCRHGGPHLGSKFPKHAPRAFSRPEPSVFGNYPLKGH